MNLRHKAVLFITLVVTGTCLLAGATLTQGIGVAILGSAFAWTCGSDAAYLAGRIARRFLGRTWLWLRIPLAMTTAGLLVGAATILSGFNTFLASVSVAVVGAAMAPIRRPVTSNVWLRILIWALGVFGFLLAEVWVAIAMGLSDDAGRFGLVAGESILALPVGLFFLSKGYRLVIRGVEPGTSDRAASPGGLQTTDDGPPSAPTAVQKRTWLAYLGLAISVGWLLLWLAAKCFLAFSHSVFEAPQSADSTSLASPSPLPTYVAPLLLGWWAYTAWRRVLAHEPNTEPRLLRRHRRVTMAVGGLLVVVLSASITFGIQMGHDRRSTYVIEQGKAEFELVATRIGAIKSRDFNTTADYIRGYEEIDQLLPELNTRLQTYEETLAEGARRERLRGPFSVRRIFGGNDDEWIEWDQELFGLLRTDTDLTTRQVAVVRQMSALPVGDQVAFWNSSLKPLLEEEQKLREQLSAMLARKPAR